LAHNVIGIGNTTLVLTAFALAIWIIFVISVKSTLPFPWDLIKVTTGFLAVYFWFRAAGVGYLQGKSSQNNITNGSASKKDLSPCPRSSYLILGFLAWLFFIYSTSTYLDLTSIVLYYIMGLLSPCAFLVSANQVINSKTYRFEALVSDESTRINRDIGTDKSYKYGLIVFFFALIFWISFICQAKFENESLFLSILFYGPAPVLLYVVLLIHSSRVASIKTHV
jgi:hypothetical protein